ncbi:hypothetical protein AVEN_14802-1 [Araneus ventricosus]|uniref:Uncharacterized protein n=1 Tax=Araneus ventricosus TaxID=182803 RepID=A0A4Y2FH43_ARAVE|nr:hypothetical protein AVEN_14802-1 [Araneus ventricosus]
MFLQLLVSRNQVLGKFPNGFISQFVNQHLTTSLAESFDPENYEENFFFFMDPTHLSRFRGNLPQFQTEQQIKTRFLFGRLRNALNEDARSDFR